MDIKEEVLVVLDSLIVTLNNELVENPMLFRGSVCRIGYEIAIDEVRMFRKFISLSEDLFDA